MTILPVPSVSPASLPSPDATRPVGLVGRLAAVAMLAIVGLRVFVSFTTDRFFDVDPLGTPDPFAGLGPSGSLLLDAMLLLACAVALQAERRAGRGLDLPVILLALLPFGVIGAHAAFDLQDAWRGVTWLAAAITAATAAHLARERSMRALLVAGVLGLIGALLVRSALQVLVEQPATARYFAANKSEILRARGWVEGSREARLYERRLVQLEATGWFGLSNIASGFFAAGAVAFGALLVLGGRALAPALRLLAGIAALACLALLVVNGSKGALGAGALGAIVAAFTARAIGASDRASDRASGRAADAANTSGDRARSFDVALRRAGVLVLAFAGCAILAVIARGVLPADLLSERSLLFRFHYMLGALRAFGLEPTIGVGPAGFQDAYLLVRPLESPEEVQSAHAMLFDWLATLGVAALAWLGLAALLIARVGRRPLAGVAEERTNESTRGATPSLPPLLLIALSISVFGGVLVEWPVLDPTFAALRIVGLGAALLLALVVHEACILDRRAATTAIVGAVAVIAVHAQIEMLFWQPGSVAWSWLLLGAAAPAAMRARAGGLVVIPAALAAIALGVLAFPHRDARAADGYRERAAAPLAALGILREEASLLTPGLAPVDRAAAGAALGPAVERAATRVGRDSRFADAIRGRLADPDFEPRERDPRRLADALVRELEPVARRSAADELVAGFDRVPEPLPLPRILRGDLPLRDRRPFDRTLAERSTDQLRALAQRVPERERDAIVLEAIARAGALESIAPTASTASRLGTMLREAVDAGVLRDVNEAVDVTRRAIVRDPADARRHLALGDFLARHGRDEEARVAWRRALELDDLRTPMDPLVALDADDRVRLERLVAEDR